MFAFRFPSGIGGRLAALFTLGAALTGTAAWAQSADDTAAMVPRTAHPNIRLRQGDLHGDAALSALGRHLPTVAAAYGKTPAGFIALMRQDRLLRLDNTGRLYVVDELPAQTATALPDEEPQPAAASLSPTPRYKLADTFKLHSNPTAKRTIYLNFKGANLTGTAWAKGSTVVAPAFTLDSDSSTFNDTELTRIQAIWQRVAEDFAPLAVDVTTEEPPAARLQRSSSTDIVYGTTVVITNNTNVYSCSCGGIAYVGVFDDTSDYYKPALVFHNKLGNSEKSIAEAISHEAGHNAGLSHDSTTSVEYYAGHGSGVTSWAPIMGVGYSKNVVQWSKGEYPNATNKEDDFAVMRANGLPIRGDDHGNTPDVATPLTIVSVVNGVTTLSGAGIIASQADVDAFWVDGTAGATLQLFTKPDTLAPNLDVTVTLQDTAGNVLALLKPKASLTASVNVVLPTTDRYTLLVSGSGFGDPAVDGYSKYGSVGQYTIKGTLTPAP